jgi:hypothetical protein
MARKKGTPAGEQSRRDSRDSDLRYKNPLDARIQTRRVDQALRKLREGK